jgi:hypothetical protein
MNKPVQWIKSRAKEPSSVAGLGLLIAGVGQMAGINEAPAVAEAVTQVGGAAISGGWGGALMAVLGLLAMSLRERGGQ